MKCIKLKRTYRGRDITALAHLPDVGIQISVFGGDLSHIGAVGFADSPWNITVTQFDGHREGVICKKWLDLVCSANILPAVVTAGIHYDDLGREGIEDVLELTDSMLDELLSMLRRADDTGLRP